MAQPPRYFPDPGNPRLPCAVDCCDHMGIFQTVRVVKERPLTIFLNAPEIAASMTFGDHPDYLAPGFLRNLGLLRDAVVAATPQEARKHRRKGAEA